MQKVNNCNCSADLAPNENDNQRSLRYCIQRLKRLADGMFTNGEVTEVAKATYRNELSEVIRTLERLEDNSATSRSMSMCEDFNVVDFSQGTASERVPNEVRDWLQMTFRRSPPPSTASAPIKFRTIARAVRMSLSVFNRPTPCSSVLQPKESDFMKKFVNEWTFDVFKLNEITDGHALRATGFFLFDRYGLSSKFRIAPTTLDCFLLNLEKGYSKYENPYHNLMHAADVAQTLHFFIHTYNLPEWLTDLQILSSLVAALIHDYEHNGTTNNFHVNSSSELALFYNDRAVLENHHASAAFRMMQGEECNILSELSTDDYRSVRALVIDMVLATEMKGHCLQLKTMKTAVSLNEELDWSFVLGFLLHVSDVAHPAKEWLVHRRMALLILDEFFRQGDIERAKNLPLSPLCDRHTTLVPHSQIGFIDCVVTPSMSVVTELFQYIASRSTSSHAKEDNENSVNNRDRNRNKDSGDSAGDDRKVATAIRKPWEYHLQQNRHRWTEEADAIK